MLKSILKIGIILLLIMAVAVPCYAEPPMYYEKILAFTLVVFITIFAITILVVQYVFKLEKIQVRAEGIFILSLFITLFLMWLIWMVLQ